MPTGKINSTPIREFVKGQYGQMVDWLKYAEAKNAVLLALDGAVMAGLVSGLLPAANAPAKQGLALFLEWYKAWVFLFSCLSGTVCLLSFAPRLKVLKIRSHIATPTGSLLFFKHIAHLSDHDYLRRVAQAFNQESMIEDNLCRDYASQIIAIARTCLWKHKMFSAALYILLVGLLAVFVLPIRIALSRREKKDS